MPFLPASHKSQQIPENAAPVAPVSPTPPVSSSNNKLKDFEAVFPKLVKDLEENAKQYQIPEEALKWYSNVRSSCHPPAPTPIPASHNAILLP